MANPLPVEANIFQTINKKKNEGFHQIFSIIKWGRLFSVIEGLKKVPPEGGVASKMDLARLGMWPNIGIQKHCKY